MSQSTTTWQQAGPIRWLRSQPVERRHTVLAALFALVAAVWAPLGVLAFLTRSTALFVVVTLAAVVLVAAPRPVLAEGELATRLSSFGSWLRDGLRRDALRVADWVLRTVRRLRHWVEERQGRPTSSRASS